MLTSLWCPRCPICRGAGLRDPELQALDCWCQHCGWHYTSPLKRAVLLALSESARRAVPLLALALALLGSCSFGDSPLARDGRELDGPAGVEHDARAGRGLVADAIVHLVDSGRALEHERPDGAVLEDRPDGAVLEHEPDGSVREHEPDGNVREAPDSSPPVTDAGQDAGSAFPALDAGRDCAAVCVELGASGGRPCQIGQGVMCCCD